MLAAREDREAEFGMTQEGSSDRGDHAGGVLDGGRDHLADWRKIFGKDFF